MLSPEFIAGIEDALRAEGLRVEESAPTETATFFCSATSERWFLLFVCDGTLFVYPEGFRFSVVCALSISKIVHNNPKLMRLIVHSRNLRGFQLADPACFEKAASEIRTKAGTEA